MRIGIYLGRWALDTLGGMGVYLQNLLDGVASLDQDEHQLFLLVDEKKHADAWKLSCPALILDRPHWHELSAAEQRDAIRIRKVSHRCVAQADALRSTIASRHTDAYLWGLDDVLREKEIDLLYFTIPPYLKQPVVPVLLTMHDLKHIHRPQDHRRDDLARRRRWGHAARGASLVYASYEHVRLDIEKTYGIPRERTAVLPLARPTDLQTHLAQPARLPNFDCSKPFILMPAQFWPHKNHDGVIRAIAHLRNSEHTDIPVLCTGQTGGQCADHALAMRQRANQLGVGDLIHQAGFVDRTTLIALYHAARLVLAPSLSEPGSFPAIEALTLARPLAAARITSIPDTVGDAALLFDPSDIAEMAHAIHRLWSDDALRTRLGRRGPRQIGQRSWQDVAEEWLALCARASSAAAEVVR